MEIATPHIAQIGAAKSSMKVVSVSLITRGEAGEAVKLENTHVILDTEVNGDIVGVRAYLLLVAFRLVLTGGVADSAWLQRGRYTSTSSDDINWLRPSLRSRALRYTSLTCCAYMRRL